MKIIFISNYLNHHQKPLCDNLYSKLNGNFNFISLNVIPLERLQLGYEDYSKVFYNRDYIKNFDECKKLIHEADVLIIGSASISFSLKYINSKKIIYFYSEHNFKKIDLKTNFIKLFLYSLLKYILGFMKNTYILSASSHLPNEWPIKSYKNKIFKWGYFPYSNLKNRNSYSNRKKLLILWVGRLISWKKPEFTISLAKKLKQSKINFKILMIGRGPLENKMINLIQADNLTSRIKILGSINNRKVIDYMRRSTIFLMSSDKNEGWGAVVNEAMECGCIVMTTNNPGSANYLIENSFNGFIFKKLDSEIFTNKIKEIYNNKKMIKLISTRAFKTINNLWNPKNAAKRLVFTTLRLLKGRNHFYKNGPMSKA